MSWNNNCPDCGNQNTHCTCCTDELITTKIMEKETKHTPEDKAIQNNCRWFEGYGIMVPQEMVNTLLEENERLKQRIETDWYVVALNEDIKKIQAELSEMKKERERLIEALEFVYEARGIKITDAVAGVIQKILNEVKK